MTSHRYDVLDTLRGVAALLVMLFHMAQHKLLPQWLPHGYLAVDFFFIVSGVVIAHSYEDRLARGMGLGSFMLRRVVRLYPLLVLGVAIGSVVRLARYLAAPASVDPLDELLVASVLNSVLVPMVYGSEMASRALYPVNGPLWSLFFELVANLAWAALLVGRRTRVLVVVVLVAALLDAACIRHWGHANIGWDRDSFVAGFPRVTYGFTLGVLLYRWRDQLRWPAGRLTDLALAAALVLVALPAPSARWDMVCVFLLLPLLVAAGLGRSSHRVGQAIGNSSYPIYVLHFPLIVLAVELQRSLPDGLSRRLVGPATVVLILTLAWGAWRAYDTPVRRVLSRRWVG